MAYPGSVLREVHVGEELVTSVDTNVPLLPVITHSVVDGQAIPYAPVVALMVVHVGSNDVLADIDDVRPVRMTFPVGDHCTVALLPEEAGVTVEVPDATDATVFVVMLLFCIVTVSVTTTGGGTGALVLEESVAVS